MDILFFFILLLKGVPARSRRADVDADVDAGASFLELPQTRFAAMGAPWRICPRGVSVFNRWLKMAYLECQRSTQEDVLLAYGRIFRPWPWTRDHGSMTVEEFLY